MTHPRLTTAGRVLAVAVIAVGAAVGGYAVAGASRHPAAAPAPTSTAPPLPSAYRQASSAPGPTSTAASAGAAAPVPVPSAIARAVDAALKASALGGQVRAEVADAATGQVLLQQAPRTAAAPASTGKLLTVTALLAVRPAEYRITTTVRRGGGGSIVIVGGGDPTLSGAAAGSATPYSGAARLSDLAAQLRRAHVRPTRIVVDDALFSGPGISPAWAPEDVPSTYASAITALMADGGRDAPGDALRSASPELAVGHELAAALGQPHLQVVRGRAPAGAPTLASVRSAPLATLVAETLATSDNVLAECLARQVAIATGHPPSFAGAAAAVRAVLKRLGVDPGDGMVDGSGLAASDRVSAATLVGVLRLAAGPAHPELHRVATALPLAAWSGTLAGRYLRGASQAGAGVVRAKTGTLTGVSTLAGLVHDRDGRLLIFALLAHQVPSTPAADAALDVVAARLAGCGCP